MTEAIVVGLLGVLAVARKVYSWRGLSSEERGAVIRHVLLMVGSATLSFTMLASVDGGYVRSRPDWARTLWLVGILSTLFLAIGGWAKLMDIEILPGEGSRRVGAEAFLAQVSQRGHAWKKRAWRGAVLMLLWGGLGAVFVLVAVARRSGFVDGIIVAGGFLAVLALSGAVGGVTYHGTEPLRLRGGVFHVSANVVSLLAYCAAAVILLLLGSVVAQEFGVGW